MTQYINFSKISPQMKNLIVGTSDKIHKDLVNKKILVILDTTGSMQDVLNTKGEGTKIDNAKLLIKSIMESFPANTVEILPFSNKPHPICTLETLREPSDCTYFSPILPFVKDMLKFENPYAAIVFMSDGIPTEDSDIARKSIQDLGSFSREVGANTISLAIGTDADGVACSMFSGNRGHSCFVKFKKDFQTILTDITTGINCNYVQLNDGTFSPVDKMGKYYFLSETDLVGSECEPTYELVEKYINLLFQEQIKSSGYINDHFQSIIKIAASVLSNNEEKERIEKYFGEIMNVVQRSYDMFGGTPSAPAAVEQAYRGVSQFY